MRDIPFGGDINQCARWGYKLWKVKVNVIIGDHFDRMTRGPFDV